MAKNFIFAVLYIAIYIHGIQHRQPIYIIIQCKCKYIFYYNVTCTRGDAAKKILIYELNLRNLLTLI